MKNFNSRHELFCALVCAVAALAFVPGSTLAASQKPRVIATSDGEVDDHSTMVRFLMYSSDYDVMGIVEVNSRFQRSGHSGEPWLENQLDAYEKVLPNLRKHNPDYPSASYLRSVVRVGNENSADLQVAPPDMATKNTPGAQLIIDTLLDNDPRPVHVISWGGANTTASALWKLKTEYPKEKFDYAVSRIRIYCIWYQDGGGSWIQNNIPGAYINEAYRWSSVWDYGSVDGARGGGRGGIPNTTTSQSAALNAMNQALTNQNAAQVAARTAWAAAAFGNPGNDADLRLKAGALSSAELALANARADQFTRLQAGTGKLNAAQIPALIALGGRAGAGGGGGGGRGSSNPPEIQAYMNNAWLSENVQTNHGPLGAVYPQRYVSEGDTPSFLHLINNGLQADQDYTLGGWGGRSVYDNPAFPNHITDQSNVTDDGNQNKMYWRWIPAAQNDFQARMDWCVKEFKDANHPPVAKVTGALKRDVKAGETVKLEATATDPDGNQLTYKWWQYADADSAAATVAIANSDSRNQASAVMPNEAGKQVHIILEVTDNGTPPLVGYQRVLLNIK